MNEPEDDIEEACETKENISETKETEEVTEELTTECNSRETNDSQKNLMDRLQEAIDTFNDCIVEAEVNNDPDSAQKARELADKVEEARENFKKLTGEK